MYITFTVMRNTALAISTSQEFPSFHLQNLYFVSLHQRMKKASIPTYEEQLK